MNGAIAMQEFFYNGQTGGAFYLESVATAVLAQIIYRRSNLSGRLKRPPEFLDPNLLKSALEYIRAHLSQELNLKQIAATVGFSPYHFARAFEVTTGLSTLSICPPVSAGSCPTTVTKPKAIAGANSRRSRIWQPESHDICISTNATHNSQALSARNE